MGDLDGNSSTVNKYKSKDADQTNCFSCFMITLRSLFLMMTMRKAVKEPEVEEEAEVPRDIWKVSLEEHIIKRNQALYTWSLLDRPAESLTEKLVFLAATSGDLPLENRTAIVTGGSRGIGRAVSLHLASLGANLVIGYASNTAQANLLISELNASSSPSRPRAVAVQANVSDPSSAKLLFDVAESSFGGPAHILVNCASVVVPKTPTLAATSVVEWDAVFNVNCRGTFLCCREAAARLARGGGGRIVNFATTMNAKPLPGFAASSASKAAVVAITRFLAKELAGTKIAVNCVAPGEIQMEIFGELGEGDGSAVVKECPMGRLTEAPDVPAVVGFLVIDEAEWVNGQVIRVNCGYA